MMARAGQSRVGSLVEAVVNVVAGYLLALLIQALVYPAFGIVTTVTTDMTIAALFTGASLVRSYIVRRLFEAALRPNRGTIADARP